MEADPEKQLAALRLVTRLVAALLIVVLAGAGVAPASQSADPPLPLTLIDPVQGRPVELHPGAPVLHLVFFATWCPPCRAELPRLTELVTRWGEGGYRLVVVAVQARQSVERLQGFLESAGIEGEVLFDSTGAVQRAFRADQLPTHVLLDASGEVVRRAPGLDDDVEATIERIMKERDRGSGRR